MNIYIPDFIVYLIAVLATLLVIMKLKKFENESRKLSTWAKKDRLKELRW